MRKFCIYLNVPTVSNSRYSNCVHLNFNVDIRDPRPKNTQKKQGVDPANGIL